MSSSLESKVAVLTGGGGVLCGTLATALAREGAQVAILDIDIHKARQSASLAGEGAWPIQVDVTDAQSVAKAATQLRSQFGKIDILINGAGGNRPKATTGPDLEFFDLSPEAIREVMDLNLMGTVIPCQVFGRLMAEANEGCIVNISSLNALRPLTRIPAYSAAKAAVSNFTLWLAVHMSRKYSTRIRVNAIAPGFFLTEQNHYLLIDEASGELTERGRAIVEHTPMKCFGQPEDLVGTVLWLCSDGARFVHGAVIPVDGGFNAYSGV